MKLDDFPKGSLASDKEQGAAGLLSPLLQGHATLLPIDPIQGAVPPLQAPVHGAITGTLVALADNGQTALVSFPGQPGSSALRARTTIDLHGPHIGQDVVLFFEEGDVYKPIVMGVLRGKAGWPLAEAPATVEVDAGGERMVVSAKSQMVLRCGKASITLTESGKVLIDGTYVLTRSTGMNRIKGGSVQLN